MLSEKNKYCQKTIVSMKQLAVLLLVPLATCTPVVASEPSTLQEVRKISVRVRPSLRLPTSSFARTPCKPFSPTSGERGRNATNTVRSSQSETFSEEKACQQLGGQGRSAGSVVLVVVLNFCF